MALRSRFGLSLAICFAAGCGSGSETTDSDGSAGTTTGTTLTTSQATNMGSESETESGDATSPTGTASESDSETTEGPTTDPSTTDPSTTDPSTTDPSTTDPSTTDPSTTDPSTTDDPTDETGSTTGMIDMCKVNDDDMNAPGDCEQEAPPDSFEPIVEWTFTDQVEPYSYVTPLVMNLTDDNDDGEIDLCDIPDVVVVFGTNPGPPNTPGHVFVLDGATGELHFRIDTAVDSSFTPAIGDIDNDGIAEIVTVTPQGSYIVFEHDGTTKWEAPANWQTGDFFGQSLQYSSAVSLADVDNDGDVEIIAANHLVDHEGNFLLTLPALAGQWGATVAADLDDDGDLEIVLGHAAYHHDGTPVFVTNLVPGYPQIADLDDDGLPEVLLTNRNGISLIEHDGTVVFSNLRPTGDPASGTTWHRPATIHDFDGDGKPEFAVSSANHYTVYEADASIVWMANISDNSGIAAGTAFDFLGDGVAEAMYADEQHMYVFDGAGVPLLQVSRKSGTLSEYPTVADIDNDNSAEILVVSNGHLGGGDPGVQAFRDVEDRWIQARRIWNQHAYHVTNVREDGTIPQFQVPSWTVNNTFRTNAQIEGGGICIPQ